MEANILRGANLIEQFKREFSFPFCHQLVHLWLAKGANLALAGLLTRPCAETVQCIFPDQANSMLDAAKASRDLYLHSSQSLNVQSSTTIDEYCTHFCQYNCRWETLGLFFTVVSRAATDLSHDESCFESEEKRRHIQRLSMSFSDLCLDIAISLDCLNDLQLILQYENFILHSFVDGDQSMSER